MAVSKLASPIRVAKGRSSLEFLVVSISGLAGGAGGLGPTPSTHFLKSPSMPVK